MLESPIPIGITLSSLPFALVAFQSFLLSLILCFKKSESANLKVANKVFAGLLLIFCLMLVEHTMDLSGYFFLAPDLIGMIYPLYFLIGPFIYAYVRIQTSPNPVFLEAKDFWHIIPTVLLIVIILPYLLSDGNDGKLLLFYDRLFPVLSEADSDLNFECDMVTMIDWLTCDIKLSLVNGQPQFDMVFFSPIVLIWLFDWTELPLWISLLFYSVVSLKLLKKHKLLLRQITSNIDGRDLSWLRHFTRLLALTIIIFLFIGIQTEFLDNPLSLSEVGANYFVYGMLSICVLYVGIRALQQPELFSPKLAKFAEEVVSDQYLDRTEKKQTDEMISKQCEAKSERISTAHHLEEKLFALDEQQTPSVRETQDLQDKPHNLDKTIALENPAKQKYRNSPVTPLLANDLSNLVNEHMHTEKSYLNPQLTLPDLAEKLSISPHVLSQVLNETLNKNFFEFVNSFRIERAKIMLLEKKDKPVLQVAMDCGFNSKTAFYSAFNKVLGLTPRQWSKQSNLQ